MIDPNYIYPGFIDEVKGALNGSSGNAPVGDPFTDDDALALVVETGLAIPFIAHNGVIYTDENDALFVI